MLLITCAKLRHWPLTKRICNASTYQEALFPMSIRTSKTTTSITSPLRKQMFSPPRRQGAGYQRDRKPALQTGRPRDDVQTQTRRSNPLGTTSTPRSLNTSKKTSQPFLLDQTSKTKIRVVHSISGWRDGPARGSARRGCIIPQYQLLLFMYMRAIAKGEMKKNAQQRSCAWPQRRSGRRRSCRTRPRS